MVAGTDENERLLDRAVVVGWSDFGYGEGSAVCYRLPWQQQGSSAARLQNMRIVT